MQTSGLLAPAGGDRHQGLICRRCRGNYGLEIHRHEHIKIDRQREKEKNVQEVTEKIRGRHLHRKRSSEDKEWKKKGDGTRARHVEAPE